MDDNCGEWVECMGVASGCGEQEVGVASGRTYTVLHMYEDKVNNQPAHRHTDRQTYRQTYRQTDIHVQVNKGTYKNE